MASPRSCMMSGARSDSRARDPLIAVTRMRTALSPSRGWIAVISMPPKRLPQASMISAIDSRPGDQRQLPAGDHDRAGRADPAFEQAVRHRMRLGLQGIRRPAVAGIVEGRVHDDVVEAFVDETGGVARLAGQRHIRLDDRDAAGHMRVFRQERCCGGRSRPSRPSARTARLRRRRAGRRRPGRPHPRRHRDRRRLIGRSSATSAASSIASMPERCPLPFGCTTWNSAAMKGVDGLGRICRHLRLTSERAIRRRARHPQECAGPGRPRSSSTSRRRGSMPSEPSRMLMP